MKLMKKKMIFAATAAFTAAAVSAFAYVSSERESMDELFNANVEALNKNESGGKVCYNSITSSDGQQVNYCPLCTFIPGKPHFWSPDHTCSK